MMHGCFVWFLMQYNGIIVAHVYFVLYLLLFVWHVIDFYARVTCWFVFPVHSYLRCELRFYCGLRFQITEYTPVTCRICITRSYALCRWSEMSGCHKSHTCGCHESQSTSASTLKIGVTNLYAHDIFHCCVNRSHFRDHKIECISHMFRVTSYKSVVAN